MKISKICFSSGGFLISGGFELTDISGGFILTDISGGFILTDIQDLQTPTRLTDIFYVPYLRTFLTYRHFNTCRLPLISRQLLTEKQYQFVRLSSFK